MAFYQPPTQNLGIFDPDVFDQNDEPLTIETGSKYFLRLLPVVSENTPEPLFVYSGV